MSIGARMLSNVMWWRAMNIANTELIYVMSMVISANAICLCKKASCIIATRDFLRLSIKNIIAMIKITFPLQYSLTLCKNSPGPLNIIMRNDKAAQPTITTCQRNW